MVSRFLLDCGVCGSTQACLFCERCKAIAFCSYRCFEEGIGKHAARCSHRHSWAAVCKAAPSSANAGPASALEVSIGGLALQVKLPNDMISADEPEEDQLPAQVARPQDEQRGQVGAFSWKAKRDRGQTSSADHAADDRSKPWPTTTLDVDEVVASYFGGEFADPSGVLAECVAELERAYVLNFLVGQRHLSCLHPEMDVTLLAKQRRLEDVGLRHIIIKLERVDAQDFVEVAAVQAWQAYALGMALLLMSDGEATQAEQYFVKARNSPERCLPPKRRAVVLESLSALYWLKNAFSCALEAASEAFKLHPNPHRILCLGQARVSSAFGSLPEEGEA